MTYTSYGARALIMIRRVISAAAVSVLTFASLAASGAWGCGKGPAGGYVLGGAGDGGLGANGDASAPSVQGLTSISITPATISLPLQYPVSAQGATTQLTATGTFADGHTADVTEAVSWAVSPGDLASVGGGGLTAGSPGEFSSPAPGTFRVTAAAGSITSNAATVTVMLAASVVGTGVTQTDLDGTPSGPAPTIAYPLDGALFPYKLGPIEFQLVPSTPAQTEARIAFEGPGIDLKVYEPCVPIPSPTAANACAVTVPADLEVLLDGASEDVTLTETVRLAAPGGASLAESAPLGARWSSSQLHGGLYYWSADIDTGNTLIMRYDLDTPGTAPEQYFTQTGTNGALSSEQAMDPPASNGSTVCFGCHAISLDGTKIGLTFGGSEPALFALIDVASEKTIATRLFPTDANAGQPFAAFSAFFAGRNGADPVGPEQALAPERRRQPLRPELRRALRRTARERRRLDPVLGPEGGLHRVHGLGPQHRNDVLERPEQHERRRDAERRDMDRPGDGHHGLRNADEARPAGRGEERVLPRHLG